LADALTSIISPLQNAFFGGRLMAGNIHLALYKVILERLLTIFSGHSCGISSFFLVSLLGLFI
jgi:hypothetical protein